MTGVVGISEEYWKTSSWHVLKELVEKTGAIRKLSHTINVVSLVGEAFDKEV